MNNTDFQYIFDYFNLDYKVINLDGLYIIHQIVIKTNRFATSLFMKETLLIQFNKLLRM
jgi:hypothetical protein